MLEWLRFTMDFLEKENPLSYQNFQNVPILNYCLLFLQFTDIFPQTGTLTTRFSLQLWSLHSKSVMKYVNLILDGQKNRLMDKLTDRCMSKKENI